MPPMADAWPEGLRCQPQARNAVEDPRSGLTGEAAPEASQQQVDTRRWLPRIACQDNVEEKFAVPERRAEAGTSRSSEDAGSVVDTSRPVADLGPCL